MTTIFVQGVLPYTINFAPSDYFKDLRDLPSTGLSYASPAIVPSCFCLGLKSPPRGRIQLPELEVAGREAGLRCLLG